MAEKLPLCKYGGECYRKNPQHFREFSHPHMDNKKEHASTSNCKRQLSSEDDTQTKRAKHSDGSHLTKIKPIKKEEKSSAASSDTSSGNVVEMCPVKQVNLGEKTNKYKYYMTYVHRGIHSSFNRGSAISLGNVLSGTDAELIDSCVFSYMYDIEWIRQQYKPADRNKPMTLVEGLKGVSRVDLLEQRGNYTNIKIVQAKLDIMYGVHHTKMIILRYKTGIRVMITTANLVPLDWFQKSQALWCSPLCAKGDGDSETGFKADLIEYLSAYKSRLLNEWVEVVKQYDMSKCKVFLIASVPGRHTGEKKSAFGHLKMRKILRQHGPAASECSDYPVIGQFSSIGRLGTSPSNWLTGEFLTSLSTTKGAIVTGAKPELKLIYPTVENVRTSLEGYMAGGSLPFAKQTYDQQPYIKSLFHQWKCDSRGRSEAAPHIKTYLRISQDHNKIPWFLMTSSNLSKAAWGMYEKQESQLMIRSYELGVLFLPKMYDLDTFICDPTFTDVRAFPLPFDLPLTPYRPSDEPWIVDKKYTDKRDTLGDFWT